MNRENNPDSLERKSARKLDEKTTMRLIANWAGLDSRTLALPVDPVEILRLNRTDEKSYRTDALEEVDTIRKEAA